jgi:hypothetical protein
MEDYAVSYSGCPDLGSQELCSGLALEDAFSITAQEIADSFFANGGDSYNAADIDYTVLPNLETV